MHSPHFTIARSPPSRCISAAWMPLVTLQLGQCGNQVRLSLCTRQVEAAWHSNPSHGHGHCAAAWLQLLSDAGSGAVCMRVWQAGAGGVLPAVAGVQQDPSAHQHAMSAEQDSMALEAGCRRPRRVVGDKQRKRPAIATRCCRCHRLHPAGHSHPRPRQACGQGGPD